MTYCQLKDHIENEFSHNGIVMIFLLCHICAGAVYRTRTAVEYRSDVCAYDSLKSLHLRAHDFDSGLFDCLRGPENDIRRNLFACCCTPVRYSANASAPGLMEFWVALILSSIFFPFMWTFGFIGRSHIRDEYNMERKPFNDCCVWAFCYVCSLVQESKFIDKGFRAIREGEQAIPPELTEVYVPPVIPKAAPK